MTSYKSVFKQTWGLLILSFILSACLPAANNQLSFVSPQQSVGTTNQLTLAPIIPTLITEEPLSPNTTPSLEPTQTNTPIPFTFIPTSSSNIIGLQGFPSGVNPLTGLPVSDPSILNRRPVMIKVSNYPRTGRPHAGLSFADLVFEYYIGEQANRFLAVYYSDNAEKVGPLRSGRFVDPQLVTMYNGMLVYGSADERVDNVIQDVLGGRAISHLNAPCPPVCGGDTHSVTGVFVDSGAVTDYMIQHDVNNDRPDLTGMVFDNQIPLEGQTAITIGIEYSNLDRGEWRFDPTSGMYLRWIEADNNYTMIPMVDRLTDRQLAFSNVIIIFAEYIEYNPTLHDIKIWDNTAGQRAVFFRDANLVEGTWKVPAHNHGIQFYNKYGTPLLLKPGKTWIVIAGLSSNFSEVESGHWELMFALP